MRAVDLTAEERGAWLSRDIPICNVIRCDAIWTVLVLLFLFCSVLVRGLVSVCMCQCMWICISEYKLRIYWLGLCAAPDGLSGLQKYSLQNDRSCRCTSTQRESIKAHFTSSSATHNHPQSQQPGTPIPAPIPILTHTCPEVRPCAPMNRHAHVPTAPHAFQTSTFAGKSGGARQTGGPRAATTGH